MIVLDGLRPQEFFQGIDKKLLNEERNKKGNEAKNETDNEKENAKENKTENETELSDQQATTTYHSRRNLFPFLWGHLAQQKKTEFFGNRFENRKETCRVSNPYCSSLPAYADLLSGMRQDTVANNAFRGQMGCPSIIDKLVKEGIQPDQMALFASWQHIENVTSRNRQYRAKLHIDTGYREQGSLPPWRDARYDSQLYSDLMSHLQTRERALRFLTVIFNDTDEWGHKNDYHNYLQAIRQQDSYIEGIYRHFESQSNYRKKTIYIITTDHGRGSAANWSSHSPQLPHSHHIWAVIHSPFSAQSAWPYGWLRQNCSHIALGGLIYAFLSPGDKLAD